MNRASVAGTVFGMSAAAIMPTMATPVMSARAAIQATYNQRNAAMARKDAAGAGVGFAPDFIGVSRQGQKFSLAEHEAGMPQMLAMMKQMKRTTAIQKFAIRGQAATAQTDTIMVATVQDPRSGKMISGIIETVTIDTWVKSGSAWLQEQTQEVESRRLR